MTIKKKWLLWLGAVVCLLGVIGGCSMVEKPSLTKEQQDNVVRWIARGYDVQTVEFTKFGRNTTTGTYLLNIKVNDDNNLGTVFAIDNLSDLNEESGLLGLDPIEDFAKLEKEEPLSQSSKVDISQIKINYLKE